jgi:predicted regulator of Ras-like GTPase activity (Roadblock/LC7/MglB family)
METILQGLMELSGVRAAMVLDGTGQLVAHRGQAVYDRALCDQVGGQLTKAIESIQLQQEDWETVAAQFGDGKILLRRVSPRPDGPRHVIAIVADGTLNASFATVALRVAANKVKAAIEGGSSSHPWATPLPTSSQPPGSAPLPSSSQVPPASDSRPNLANTGLSWSKGNVSSSLGSSIAVADPASSAFLLRCVHELARHVGPMSKVYVQEAIRRVSPDAPFSLASMRPLIDDLSSQIEDAKDRTAFRKALLEKK